jgi:hypothetical protein
MKRVIWDHGGPKINTRSKLKLAELKQKIIKGKSKYVIKQKFVQKQWSKNGPTIVQTI